MRKPFYTDYVRHIMRFYARNLSLQFFKKDIDKHNWYVCHDVINTYSDRDKDILVYVYGSYDTFADNVYEMSKKHHVHQNYIWDMMKEFERKLAKQRSLI